MRLPALLITDLHLVESPSTEYRWGLFPWLHETIKEEKVKTLCILGDLTDAKDNHSAALTNRVAKEIRALGELCRVLVLTGNHDWLKDGQEFFRFLGMLPNVSFITDPWEDEDVEGPSAYFLPYSKNPAKDWAGLDFSHYEHLFMHQTVKGAVSSNGQLMDGEPLPPLNAAKVWSGDIHVPQVITTDLGTVEYVGSPYQVHFGDNFKPRAVLIEKNGNYVDLHFKTVGRRSIRVKSLEELEEVLVDTTRPKDQAKVTIQLAESEKHEWSRIRRAALAMLTEFAIDVHGIALDVQRSSRRIDNEEAAKPRLNPSDSVFRFVRDEELTGDALDIALEVIES
jgi:DNA repair exonuclease SbcCD nuclease subunit